MTVVAELRPDSLAEVPPTASAMRLLPSEWPRHAGFLFRPREPFRPAGVLPDGSLPPVIVTRYGDVLAMMLDPSDIWQRNIPESVIPEAERDLVVDASWMLDGEEHKRLRNVIGSINRGFTDEAPRQFTRDLTRRLLGALMEEPPPWNLARVIDEVAIRVIIEHILKAPMLLPSALRMRELTRARAPEQADHGTDLMAYFQTNRRQPLEDILGLVPAHADQLPADGLARHMVGLTGTVMTSRQLLAQLAMLITSYESQSAVAASLIGMLLQHGLFDEAREFAASEEGMTLLVAEGGRRGLSFPFNVLTPAEPVTMGGLEIPAGEPVFISDAAANMTTDRFGEDAAGFNPRAARPAHLAFGQGMHRCQGERLAEQITADLLGVLLDEKEGLPRGIQLAGDGRILREVGGLSWAVARLPVVPAGSY